MGMMLHRHFEAERAAAQTDAEKREASAAAETAENTGTGAEEPKRRTRKAKTTA